MAADTPSGGSPPSGPSKGPSKESIDIATKLGQALNDLHLKNKSLNSEFEKSQSLLSALGVSGAKSFKGLNTSMDIAGVLLEGITGTAKSFGKAFSSALTTAKRQISMATNALSFFGRTIIGVGRSFLSFPMALFGTIANKAAELLNGSTALRQAYENVRKTFGDLSKAESKSVLTAFKELRSSAHSLGGSTLSLSRIYGYGPDGLAKALEELTETAHAMGPIFGLLRRAFETSADDLLIYQKGLGLSAEQMRAFGSISVATGRPLNDLLKETGNLALQMGDKFGISSKELGRDLGYMTQNMGKFGSMTKTQMATSAVFTRKLGLEIKELEGLISKFDDFESTAEGASRLAQAFGMNVDALSMMKEQDPAKRLDMLRKSFAATGKSIENMSRQERALLAETSGLDENTVALALSTKNMGLSYDQVQKQAEDSNKKQKSQAEIMQGLSENIERFIETIQHSSSFLTQFLNGFMRGISRSKVFREALHDMATALRSVYKFGIKVGEAFAVAFPGFEGMVRTIGDFAKQITEISKTGGDSIKSFFEAFSTAEGAKQKISELFNFLTGQGSIAGTSLTEFNEHYNTFLTAIANGIEAMIPLVADKMVAAINEITTNLNGGFDAAAAEVQTKANPIVRILIALINGVKKVLPKLITLFVEVIQYLFTDPETRNSMMIGATALFAFIAGPTMISFLGSLFTSLLGAAFSIAMSLLPVILAGGEGAAALTAALGPTFMAAGTGLLSAGGAILGMLGSIAAFLMTPPGWALIAAGLVFAIGAALKAVGRETFVESIKSLFGDDAAWFAEGFYNVVYFFENLMTGLSDIWSGFTGMLSGSLKFWRGVFTGDFEMMGQGFLQNIQGFGMTVLGAMESIFSWIPGAGTFFEGFKEAFGITKQQAAQVASGNKEAMEQAVPKGNEAGIQTAGNGNFLTMPKDNSLTGQARAAIQVGEESKNLKKAVKNLSDEELLQNLSLAQAGIDSLDNWYSRFSTSTFFANYEDIGSKFSGITTALAQVSSGNFGAIAKETAKDIVEMNKALATLDPIKMDATLDRLGENLSFKNEVMTLERKPVVVNIDLKLSIKAEEFVKDYEKVKSNMILRGEKITGVA